MFNYLGNFHTAEKFSAHCKLIVSSEPRRTWLEHSQNEAVHVGFFSFCHEGLMKKGATHTNTAIWKSSNTRVLAKDGHNSIKDTLID